MKRISYPYFFDCAATPKRLQLSLTQTTAACLSTRTFSRSIVESKDLLPTILQNAMLQEKSPNRKTLPTVSRVRVIRVRFLACVSVSPRVPLYHN